MTTTVRPPAVAGTFYPSDRDELARTVDAFLDVQRRQEADAREGRARPCRPQRIVGIVAECHEELGGDVHAAVKRLDMNLQEEFLHVLTNPTLAYLLLTIGIFPFFHSFFPFYISVMGLVF